MSEEKKPRGSSEGGAKEEEASEAAKSPGPAPMGGGDTHDAPMGGGSPRPKAQIVRLSLESIEVIMEGSTDNAVTEKIASAIDALITGLS